MAQIETVFLYDNLQPVIKLEPLFDGSETKCVLDREKVGDIYRTTPDHLVFVCAHCAAEFCLFIQFSAHIQKHLLQIHSDFVVTECTSHDSVDDNKPLIIKTADEGTSKGSANDDYADDEQYFDDDGYSVLSTDATAVQIDADADADAKVPAIDAANVPEQNVVEAEPLRTDYKCTICNRGFHAMNNLKRHKATHILEKPHVCSMCDSKFAIKRNLRRHMAKYHDQKDFQDDEGYHCEQCNKHFTKRALYEKHVNAHSSHPAWATVNQTYECYQCRDACETMAACRDHLRLHWRFVYECSKCTIKFQKQVALDRHEKICGAATALLPCGQCNKHFRSKKFLRIHSYAEHPLRQPADAAPKVRSCKLCPKQFYCMFEMRKHVRWHRKETNIKPYECQICGYKCLEKAMRDRHVMRHTGGMRFTCDICHRTYDVEHRKRHMQSHTGEKNHQCAECGRMFMTKTHLKSHMQSHSDERKYRCDLCPKVYKRVHKLAEHRRSHAVDFVYKCRFCPQGFKARVSLVKHSLARHDRPWNDTEK